MPIAPWRFPPLCAVLGRACCFKNITREKGEAYTTCASGEWIGFRDAAVGHREGHRVSWSHKTLGWSPYVRSAPQSGKAPQGVTMVRSLEQITMRKVYLRIL